MSSKQRFNDRAISKTRQGCAVEEARSRVEYTVGLIVLSLDEVLSRLDLDRRKVDNGQAQRAPLQTKIGRSVGLCARSPHRKGTREEM